MTLTHPQHVDIPTCDQVIVHLNDGRHFMAQRITMADRQVFVVLEAVPNLRFLFDHHFSGRSVTPDRRFCQIRVNGVAAATLRVGDELSLVSPDRQSVTRVGQITRLAIET